MLVIIDSSVFAHNLHDKIGHLHAEPAFEGLIAAQMLAVNSCEWLGTLAGDEVIKPIWVHDSKPYWREEYLKQPAVLASLTRKTKKQQKDTEELRQLLSGTEYTIEQLNRIHELSDSLAIHYKAGRSFPEYSFTKLKKKLRKIQDQLDIPSLALPGYEADDLASAIVRYIDGQERVLLLTIDSDWLGMLTSSVSWLCMTGYAPRYRYWLDNWEDDSDNPLQEWCKRRLGASISHPTDIWGIKATKGDKSDNLPVGSPMEVIDLFNPPECHDALKTHGGAIRDVVDGYHSHPRHAEKELAAISYLGKVGMMPIVKPYVPL